MGGNCVQLTSPLPREFSAWMEASCTNTFVFTLLKIHVRCFSLTPWVFFIWALPEIMTAACRSSSTATTGAHFWQLVSRFKRLFLRICAFKIKIGISLFNKFALRSNYLFNYLPKVRNRIEIWWKPKFKISTVTIKRIYLWWLMNRIVILI